MKKINVKHILVETRTKPELNTGYLLDEDNNPIEIQEHTLYVKVTYNRKTTQFKSIIKDELEDMDSFRYKYNKLMTYELMLVNNLMEKKIKKYGEDISPKGIGESVKKYDRQIYDFSIESILENLRRVVFSIESKFQGALIEFEEKTHILSLTLEAYIKLFDEPEALTRLLPEAKALDDFSDYLMHRDSKNESIHLLEWTYGDLKNDFIMYMKKKGASSAIINKVTNQINTELKSKGLI